MNKPSLSTYEKLTFEEVTRIIYYHYCDRPGQFKELMEDLMTNSDQPSKSIAPRWYTEYRDYLNENKKVK
jgi:hypothetical protein